MDIPDNYSSDTESDSESEETVEMFSLPNLSSKQSPRTSISYSGSTVSLKQIKRYFNICFHPLPTEPTEDLVTSDIPVILDHLMQFVTNKKDVTGEKILEKLAHLPHGGVDVMHKDKQFQVNLKGGSYVFPNCVVEDPMHFKTPVIFMNKFCNTFHLNRFEGVANTEHHHDRVKAYMAQFCRITSECVFENGDTLQRLEATRMSTRTGKVRSKVFTVQPDLMLVPVHRKHLVPALPFEVYSSVKMKEVRVRKESQKNKAMKRKRRDKSTTTTSTSDNFITDEDSKIPLDEFLAQNTPDYMFKNLKRSSQYRFKSKLVAQHVLHIIASASDYCYIKSVQREPVQFMQRNRVFIGFFVCEEYVYVTKVQGDELNFARYTRDIVRQVINGGLGSDGKLHVQFSPIVLDLTIHNHRIALLKLMQYYMYNWDEIQTDKMNSK